MATEAASHTRPGSRHLSKRYLVLLSHLEFDSDITCYLAAFCVIVIKHGRIICLLTLSRR